MSLQIAHIRTFRKSLEEMREIARQNIEAHIEGEEPDDIYEDAYVLGFDALVDKGCESELASQIATELAMGYAFP